MVSKVSQVCGMELLFPSDSSSVYNILGGDIYVGRDVDRIKVPISSATLKEAKKDIQGLVEQELSAVVTDSGWDAAQNCAEPCLVLLHTTDGIERVVGTYDSPVRLSVELSGSPSRWNITWTGNSAEFAKLMQSF